MLPVKLRDIADAIEAAHDEFAAYLDRQTGDVVQLPVELLAEAGEEDPDDADEPGPGAKLHDWEQEGRALARQIAGDGAGRYLRLPDKFDVHEWRMMADFVGTFGDDRIGPRLRDAIHGGGAFRRFKDAAGDLGVLDAWYAFKNDRYFQLARRWCDEHNVPVTADSPRTR